MEILLNIHWHDKKWLNIYWFDRNKIEYLLLLLVECPTITIITKTRPNFHGYGENKTFSGVAEMQKRWYTDLKQNENKTQPSQIWGKEAQSPLIS